MNRTALIMILAFGLFAFFPKQISAGDAPEFELIKGQVIDENGDGIWDFLYFTVKTKNAKNDVLVKSVNISTDRGKEYLDVPTSRIEINKRIDEYKTDLRQLNLSGRFNIEVLLDTSALNDKDDIADGGPGPNPNETIIIIDYP